MNIDWDSFCRDISVFCDLGSVPHMDKSTFPSTFSISRNGDIINLRNFDTFIEEGNKQTTRRHLTIFSLLAGDAFANLPGWKLNQQLSLASEFSDLDNLITVKAESDLTSHKFDAAMFNSRLASQGDQVKLSLFLIDGPAGIGKTYFIASIAKLRIADRQRPPVLHVQARGMQLISLYHLIAFSLQRLRVNITYDQIPVLIKYGVVILAIDGFDELADPDGYSHAWLKLNELISMVKHNSVIILAGRETFIGRQRIESELKAINKAADTVEVMSLLPPTPFAADEWLTGRGWSRIDIDSFYNLFGRDAFASRPFFISSIVKLFPDGKIDFENTPPDTLLGILIERILDREVPKFGDDMVRECGREAIVSYLRALFVEIARDMIENNSTVIGVPEIEFISQVAAVDFIENNDFRRLVQQRASSTPFLSNADQSGFRQFAHEKFRDYFTAAAIFQSISLSEGARILARSIFGSSLLEAFGDYVSTRSQSEVELFVNKLSHILSRGSDSDRTLRNSGALYVAVLAIIDPERNFRLSDCHIDEARFSGVASAGHFRNVFFSQLDVRGGDISKCDFEGNCIVSNLILDEGSWLPRSFPQPASVQIVSGGSNKLIRGAEISKIVEDYSLVDTSGDFSDVTNSEIFNLLGKMCRVKSYWIREDEEKPWAHILVGDTWRELRKILLDCNFIREESRPASGSSSKFVHLRKAQEILAFNGTDQEVRGLFLKIREHISLTPAQ